MASWYVAPTLEVLLDEINTYAPGRSKAADGSIGDSAHSSRESDHNPDEKGCVHAHDFTHDPAGGFDSYRFADWWRTQCLEAGGHVRYIISNGRIYNPSVSPAWRPYTGSNPHSGHVHVSVEYDSRENDRTTWRYMAGGAGEEVDDLNDDDREWLAAKIRPAKHVDTFRGLAPIGREDRRAKRVDQIRSQRQHTGADKGDSRHLARGPAMTWWLWWLGVGLLALILPLTAYLIAGAVRRHRQQHPWG